MIISLHSLQRLMPSSTVGAVVVAAAEAITIPRVRCSTFPCHPNHSNIHQTHKHKKSKRQQRFMFQMMFRNIPITMLNPRCSSSRYS